MQAFGRPLKLAVGLGLACLLVWFIYVFCLPLAMIGKKYSEIIDRVVLIALIFGAAYGSLKIKTQPRKKFIAFLLLMVFGYACACVFHFFLPTIYSNCDIYAKRLNGGAREYDGRKYVVEMCGTGGSYRMNSDDEVRLRILDDKGGLLAQRHFIVNWDASLHPLEDGPDYIVYYDDNGEDFDKRVDMPPTAWDWIGARLPFFN